MRRAMLLWGAALAAVVVAFVLVVVALNATLYSPAGFVRGYLDALARRDAASALVYASTAPLPAGRRDLLTDAALGTIDDVHIVSVADAGDARRRVTATYRAGGRSARTAFVVAPAPARLGVFAAWRFASAPLARVRITVVSDDRTRVNGLTTTTDAAATPTTFLAFAPGAYVVDTRSAYLTAAPRTVLATPDGATDVTVRAAANARFERLVRQQVDRALDECAKQHVLLPSACPFGQQVDDRVIGTPQWSIVHYPPIQLVPAGEEGRWSVVNAVGVAHLSVEVQSLYDGTERRLEQDVTFAAPYDVVIEPDGSLRMALRT